LNGRLYEAFCSSKSQESPVTHDSILEFVKFHQAHNKPKLAFHKFSNQNLFEMKCTSKVSVVILAFLFGWVITAEAQTNVKTNHRRIRNLKQFQDQATHDVLPPLSPLDDVARERNLKAGKGCDKKGKSQQNSLFGGPCDQFFDPKGKKDKKGFLAANNGLLGMNSASLFSSGSTIIPSRSLQIAISLSTLGSALCYFLI